MTVLDVMIAVGGLTDFADGNGARIVRVADGSKLYSVRLKDLVKRGDIARERRHEARRHPDHSAKLVLSRRATLTAARGRSHHQAKARTS